MIQQNSLLQKAPEEQASRAQRGCFQPLTSVTVRFVGAIGAFDWSQSLVSRDWPLKWPPSLMCPRLIMWSNHCNENQRTVDWQFAIEDARRKLKCVEPTQRYGRLNGVWQSGQCTIFKHNRIEVRLASEHRLKMPTCGLVKKAPLAHQY